MKAFVSFSLFICFTPLFASANLKLRPAIYSSDNYFKLDLSNQDINAGKYLVSIFKELDEGKVKSATVKGVIALKKQKNSFQILTPFYERLEKIGQINSFDQMKTDCAMTSEIPSETAGSLVVRMQHALDRYCRAHFLRRYSNISSFNGFKDEEFTFFSKITPFYLIGDDPVEELANFLKYLKKFPNEHQRVSNLIIEQSIKFEVSPAKKILQQIKLDERVQVLVQNKTKSSKSSQTYYVEEFSKLYKDSQEFIEKGEYAIAKQNLLTAVNFYNKNKLMIPQRRIWTSLINAGKNFYYKGREDEANELFNLSRTFAPAEEFSESYFALMWPYVISRDFAKLKALINKHKLFDISEKLDSKAQFWIATSFAKTGDEKKAATIYNRIITKSPYSFYSILSLKEISKDSKEKTENELIERLISKEEALKVTFANLNAPAIDAINRMNVWFKLNIDRLAVLESRYLLNMPIEDGLEPKSLGQVTNQEFREYIIVNMIKFLNDQGKYISSFKLFQDSFEQNTLSMNFRLVKLLFPMEYMDTIKKASQDIDPLIIISLMRQESAFNPNATSSVGAKGLMQLMPATAKRFNKKVKVRHLSDPEINIAIGVKYLKVLFERFDGNLVYTLASYNAGENRIEKWRKDIFKNDDPLANIEAIPFEETRNYVKLIYRNNFFYSILNNTSNLKTPLDETFKVSLK